jgi:ubiquinone/menaquinone biosynthesis C-methylase UbiE
MKNKVARFFDKYSIGFNSIYGSNSNLFNNFINNYFRKAMKIRFIKTMEGCFPVKGKTIIDIGCGAGHYAVALAKSGAQHIYGIDFAQGMINLAKKSAAQAQVNDICSFHLGDFMTEPISGVFDYAILMGLMDYIKEPREVIKKVLSVTKSKAFFSFPVRGGILAWQRKLRYMNRCDLFFYDKKQIYSMFKGLSYIDLTVEKIDRDFFVTVTK